MRQHKYTNRDEYVAEQKKWNARKVGHTWVKRSTVEAIAGYIRTALGDLGDVRFGICHGTRRGSEQAWFQEILGVEVIGTEIADTATEFPHTIQWDFHNVKDEWAGAVDFIYSNSLDHSHSPKQCIAAWRSCLRPGGLCFIEWTEKDHGDAHVNALDCFGASIAEMRDFLRPVDEIAIDEGHVVFVIEAGTEPMARKLRLGMTRREIINDRAWVEDRSSYIASLYRRFADDVVRLRARQRAVYAGLISRPMMCDIEAEILYLLIREMAPEIVVEIGSGSCWSTSWMLQGLRDNGSGLLMAYDFKDNTAGLPVELRKHLRFFQGDVLTAKLSKPIDFLLSDASHNEPYISYSVEQIFPLVRSGGKICVHDVFKSATPAHGEAMVLYGFMDRLGVQCYTPSTFFPESHAKILAVRKAIGIVDESIMQPGPFYNSLLIMEIP